MALNSIRNLPNFPFRDSPQLVQNSQALHRLVSTKQPRRQAESRLNSRWKSTVRNILDVNLIDSEISPVVEYLWSGTFRSFFRLSVGFPATLGLHFPELIFRIKPTQAHLMVTLRCCFEQNVQRDRPPRAFSGRPRRRLDGHLEPDFKSWATPISPVAFAAGNLEAAEFMRKNPHANML